MPNAVETYKELTAFRKTDPNIQRCCNFSWDW